LPARRCTLAEKARAERARSHEVKAMEGKLERCRHCGAVIPEGAAVYGDHNRKYCSESCARAQLDVEQGVAHAMKARSGSGSAFEHGPGDRVKKDLGPAHPRRGPVTR
jgi:hypothetical protein